MKVLLCVAALLAFLQLARPVPVDSRTERTPQDPKQTHMLSEMRKYAKACKTAGDLRNTSVPLVEDCENKAFCQVQLVLGGLLSNEKVSPFSTALDKMCRSLVAFNQHNHMNCTDGGPKSEKQSTVNFGSLLDHFMECITRRDLSKF